MTTRARRLPPARRFGRSQWALSVAAALAVVGFVAAGQWNAAVVRQQFATSAQQALAGQALQLEQEQAILRASIAETEEEVRMLQEAAEGSESALAALNQQLADVRASVGLTALRGPGVVVEIADSNRVVPADENPSNYLVLVDDVRDIVTALWASGAEGIAIKGERLVATSSIFGVGSSILVNTAFLQPPFRIEAVGAPGLLERFQAHPSFQGRVQQRIDAYGLEFATEARDDLELPPFVGNTRMQWGTPVERQL